MTKGLSSAENLRVTVAALLHATGENQTVLAGALRVTQGQISRRQSGLASWSIDDLDRLSEHFGIPVPALLSGPTHAVENLPAHRRAAVIGGRLQVLQVVSA